MATETVLNAQTMIKEVNKKKIIKSLWQNYPNSRTGLAAATELNKATITNIMSEMQEDGMVVEVAQQGSGVGRVPILVMLDKAYCLCAAVAISPNHKITVAISDIYAEILWQKVFEYQTDLASFDLLDEVTEVLQEGLDACAHISTRLLGIGVSIPRLVRVKTGDMYDIRLGEWVKLPVSDYLSQRFSAPVYVDSVANNALMAEYWFGVAKDSPQALSLFVGYGIGAGLMTDGQLYHSTSGFAGDAGHMSFDPSGAKCACGRRGCWELTGSMLYLKDQDPKEVLEKAEKGDSGAISTLDTIGRSLGYGIMNIVNLLNPGLVVVGGDIVNFGKWVMNPCQIVLQNNLKPFIRDSFVLKSSEMGRKASLLGALSRVIERLFV